MNAKEVYIQVAFVKLFARREEDRTIEKRRNRKDDVKKYI